MLHTHTQKCVLDKTANVSFYQTDTGFQASHSLCNSVCILQADNVTMNHANNDRNVNYTTSLLSLLSIRLHSQVTAKSDLAHRGQQKMSVSV